jgi:hypothetical protein
MEKENNKFSLYNITFYKPPLCKFSRRCNGTCSKLQVNHDNRKFCFLINCRNLCCNKNHFLQWIRIPQNITDLHLNMITTSCFSSEICRIYGFSKIKQILNDNLYTFTEFDNIDNLFTALEKNLELNENIAFGQEDYRQIEFQQNYELKKINLKNKKILEKKFQKYLLGQKMVKIYLNILNNQFIVDEYENEIKLYFEQKNKFSIINIINQFIGFEKIYTPFQDIEPN